jgi:hypothetical protein
MTQDEIIRLAEQANGEPTWSGGVDWTWDELGAFAKLVAQHEREKFCAVLRQLHDSYSLASNSNDIQEKGNT